MSDTNVISVRSQECMWCHFLSGASIIFSGKPFCVLSLKSYPFCTSFPWLLFFFCFLLSCPPFHLPSAPNNSSHDCHSKAVIILENVEVYIVLWKTEGREVSRLTHMYCERYEGQHSFQKTLTTIDDIQKHSRMVTVDRFNPVFALLLHNCRRQWPDNTLADRPDTVHSCSRHSVVAGTLTLEQPSSVFPL